ncbi:hypothetical protein K450DRAFT_252284 [Umbelopsis ramanniana AG]|uniref:Nucleotide-diphospho-sugar transferase n=1 Tax=Umbelopsis ramanniana AG TaxID=1314678 RepID=A0AAD5E4J2_UMBRA|nr:uncharacterized protein K450DRAFT_252284 [Umbelopsis ramanniana AG]KAI8577408.1 hypothetical protein K450DRAFT_252284 [Umbelopsis ramanniana AG]
MTGKIQKAAWAVILTTANKYVDGIAVLAHALKKHASKYPLVVLYTPETVPNKVVARLSSYGCTMVAIEAIKPLTAVEYKFERFAETWTKLRVWEQTDYDRLVLMDADMLPLQNMDELMTMPLTTNVVAACHACTCNPQKISHYPSNWTPANCAYTGCDPKAGTSNPPSLDKRDYFNSGLIVLSPDQEIFQSMLDKLFHAKDLNIYSFPDQDFLNEIFKDRWIPLAYSYNALKTLRTSHSPMWRLGNVKNIHYILTKPWDVDPSSEPDIYFPLYQLWWNEHISLSLSSA